jgi:Protein of unknown function (DUF4019)
VNTGIADRLVKNFHRQLDLAQYHEIYIQAGEEFRRAKGELEWTAILKALHEKLGNVLRDDLSGSRVVYSNTGTMISLSYNTVFSGGKAVENFTWRMAGDEGKLVGYYITSSDLITK